MSSQADHRRKKAPLARYVNYFEVSHNAVEFLIDFGQYQPEAEAVSVHSRMACGPAHAKLLVHVLSNALFQFEAEHGVIADLSPEADPLEVIYHSLPDFEDRAALLRRADEPTATPSLFHAKR